MGTLLERVTQFIPPEILKVIDIEEYSNNEISIIKVKNAFAKSNSFDMYKFILPLTTDYPLEIVEKDYYQIKKNNLFPINPGQLHCSETFGESIIEIEPFFAIFIGKKFMQKTSKKLYGKKDVVFENINYSLSIYFRNIINKLIEEIKFEKKGNQLMFESLNNHIVIELLRNLDNNFNDSKISKYRTDKKSIKNAINYIYSNYNKDFSLEEIAASVNYSPYHFLRIFKKETGQTPFQYLLDVKINKAKEKLYDANRTISQVWYASGFNNRSHFSVIFKTKTGNSPSQFRETGAM